ncbi:unnamed protein product [Chrysoparadoxa australica]
MVWLHPFVYLVLAAALRVGFPPSLENVAQTPQPTGSRNGPMKVVNSCTRNA